MNILLSGGTGFVGSQLASVLQSQGHNLYIITRSPENHEDNELTTYINFNHKTRHLPKIDAVINLAGESIFGRWTKAKKTAIKKSRIHITQHLLDLTAQMDIRPKVWINGSAVGFYGISDKTIFTEETTEPGNDFLAEVADTWESTAKQAQDMGIRTVFTRFGVILGKGGALDLMALPVKGFVGGKVGRGDQWLSWVHIDDVVGVIIHCLYSDTIEGPVNTTAPNPVQNATFMKTLAHTLNRPYWLAVPDFFIRTALGEMSQLILKGQYVLPQKAQYDGYWFHFTTAEKALQNLLEPDG